MEDLLQKKSKGILLVLLFGFLLLFLSLGKGPLAAASEIRVLVFGKAINFDTPPRLEEGRVLVPMRQIGEALAAEVIYDSANRLVRIEKGSYTVTLPIDGGNATKVVGPKETGAYSTEILTLDVPPRLENGRVLVPLRFLAESFDIEVYWNSRTATVNVGMYLTDANQAGWQLLLGHPLENEIEILVEKTKDKEMPRLEYKDLVYDPQEEIRWHNGEIWQVHTREEIYMLLDNQSHFWGPERCAAYFGQVYEEWLEWDYHLAEAKGMYQRYLNCRDLSRYGLKGAFDQPLDLSFTGALEHPERQEFAYIGAGRKWVEEMFGEPVNRETEASGEERYYYDGFQLEFHGDSLTGFWVDGGGWGTAGLYPGDSLEKIYRQLGVSQQDWEIHTEAGGKQAIRFYLRQNPVTKGFDWIRPGDLAEGEPYYILQYLLRDDGCINGISFYQEG